MTHVLLLFLDGVGLGDDDSDRNPFAAAALPVLHELLDVRSITRDTAPHHSRNASLVGLDATLGFPGAPQSGTGQASLLTGLNAVEMHGSHFGPWVPARLRDVVRDRSVLARARDAGHDIAFANAYPEEVLADAPLPSDAPVSAASSRQHRRAPQFLRAGPPLAALGAGVLDRHTDALQRGDAVASEITNEGWRQHLGRTQLPDISPHDAGRNLARIALQHDVTLFAHYTTDYAGHTGDRDSAIIALEKVDAFIGGLLEHGRDELLTIIASDHGNIEDISAGHTRNPAIGIVIGDGHAELAGTLQSLTDVVPAIMNALQDS